MAQWDSVEVIGGLLWGSVGLSGVSLGFSGAQCAMYIHS